MVNLKPTHRSWPRGHGRAYRFFSGYTASGDTYHDGPGPPPAPPSALPPGRLQRSQRLALCQRGSNALHRRHACLFILRLRVGSYPIICNTVVRRSRSRCCAASLGGAALAPRHRQPHSAEPPLQPPSRPQDARSKTPLTAPLHTVHGLMATRYSCTFPPPRHAHT